MKSFFYSLLFIATFSFISSCSKAPNTQSNGCGMPTGLAYDSLTYRNVLLKWNANNSAISYTVQYRPVGSGTWTPQVALNNSIRISYLTAATIYEWQVQTICTTGLSAYTASSIFKTDSTPPPPTYNIYATYRGSTHTFVCASGMIGYSAGDLTSMSGIESGTGNPIGLSQTYLTSSTSTFNCNPSQIPNSLGLTIGGVSYSNSVNSPGSETRTVTGVSATVIFNGTIYNTSNPSDSIVITNGSYTGPYAIH